MSKLKQPTGMTNPTYEIRMAPALTGWHPGEVRMHQELGFADAMRDRWMNIASSMSDQHRIFHTSNIPFIPITTIDEKGRPWGSLLAGANGSIGFVKSPNDTTLHVDASIWNGDPILNTIQAFSHNISRETDDSTRFLVAGIGIEHSTRRRNKLAGYIRNVWPMKSSKNSYRLDLKVNQALGNCPKYINVRKLISYTDTHPLIACQNSTMTTSDELPDEIIKLITTADTVFLASYYRSADSMIEANISQAGMNIRAGLPGFMRVDPSNKRTVIIPDYSGNRFMSSLGNISSTSMAGLTIVDFHTGNVLYLTGRAQIFIGPPAMKIMSRQTCLTAIEITGYILVHDALPIRQEPGTTIERSPYSPKVKYLVSESEGSSIESGHGLRAQLSQAVQYAHDIAIFRFKVINPRSGPTGLKILPGQAIVLDFMDWMGPPVYRHMANETPGSINDDRVRTWTVSSSHEGQDVNWFDLTMREAKQGAVTGALFNLLCQNNHGKTKEVVDLLERNVYADIVGIAGDFNIGNNNDFRMLWVAGGIGVTPFMAMLDAISQRKRHTKAIITLALATREPKIFLDLVKTSFPRALANVQITVDVFTSQGGKISNYSSNLLDPTELDVNFHNYRIPNDYWSRARDCDEIFICGPGEFGDVAQDGLKEAGIPEDKIHREGFY